MNYEKIKKSTDAVLDGVAIVIESVDGAVKCVTFTDAAGHVVRVIHDSWSMAVVVPSKPKTEKRHVVTGEVLGLKVEETFESFSEAAARQAELIDGTPQRLQQLKIEEKEVEVPF